MVDLTASAIRKPLKTAAGAAAEKLAPVSADEARAEKLHDMVAVAAYYLAERRNFEAGHELEDWLTAEAQVWAEVATPRGP